MNIDRPSSRDREARSDRSLESFSWPTVEI